CEGNRGGSSRILELESHVRQRTAELEQANQRLEREIERYRFVSAKLSASQQRMQQIVDTMTQAFWIISPARREIRFLSPAFERIVGRSVEEFYRDPELFPRIVHPDDLEMIANQREGLLRGDADEHAETVLRILRPDGSIRWARMLSHRVAHVDGEIELAGVLEDITDRKQAEDALLIRDRALAAVSDGIMITDPSQPDNPIIHCNSAFETITGYSRSEVVGRNARFLNRGDRSQPALDELRSAILDAREFRGVLRNFRKDGSVFWNDLRVAPVRDEQGRLAHFVAALTDITRRKADSDALRESETRFRLLTENMRDVLLILDVDAGRAEYISPTAEAMTGWPLAVLMRGLNAWIDLVVAEDRAAFITFLETVTVRPCSLEYRLVRKTGEVRWLLAKGFPVYNERGKSRRVVGLVEDIHPRKEAEEAMKRREAELAHAARLHFAGEMTAGLAHELSQPLQAISNYARGSMRRLRKHGEQDAEVLSALEYVSAEAGRAAEIVRRLRDFVQKREPKRERVSLSRLVADAMDLCQRELRIRGVRLQVHCTEPLMAVFCDPIQIQQVILNLVFNAVDAMEGLPPDRKLVELYVNRSENAVVLAVADCGAGVAEADLTRVFEPFFTTKQGGMGLGLTISRTIVQAHGGRVWAERNPSGGMTFSFMLPL
ncbi:MAG: PAS domain S-box protein, partial [Planctomycetota bacterium]